MVIKTIFIIVKKKFDGVEQPTPDWSTIYLSNIIKWKESLYSTHCSMLKVINSFYFFPVSRLNIKRAMHSTIIQPMNYYLSIVNHVLVIHLNCCYHLFKSPLCFIPYQVELLTNFFKYFFFRPHFYYQIDNHHLFIYFRW